MRYVVWLLWVLCTRPTWIKDGSESHLHWANTATWNSIHCNSSLEIFIKKLQGKCMDNYCLCLRTKFTPFIGLEGDGNEPLLWSCHSPEDSSFKLKAGLILSHWIAFQQGYQGILFLLFYFFLVKVFHWTVVFFFLNQTLQKSTRWKRAIIYPCRAPSNHKVITKY